MDRVREGEWVVVYDPVFQMSSPQWTKVNSLGCAHSDRIYADINDITAGDGDGRNVLFLAGEFARIGEGNPESWDGDLGVNIEAGPHGAPTEMDQVAVIRERVQDSMPTPTAREQRHPASQIFHDILVEMGDLHDRKQADYGSPTDPFANVRGSTAFGISPWVGAIVRANDKMNRLQAAARGQNLVNESIEDSLLDLAVYAIIGLVLFRQENEELADIGHGD